MTQKNLRRNNFATVCLALALLSLNLPTYAADANHQESASTVHPVAETKKAAKAVGHGVKKTGKVVGHAFRGGARAIGHGTRKVTRGVGHAFRRGAHALTGKKD